MTPLPKLSDHALDEPARRPLGQALDSNVRKSIDIQPFVLPYAETVFAPHRLTSVPTRYLTTSSSRIPAVDTEANPFLAHKDDPIS